MMLKMLVKEMNVEFLLKDFNDIQVNDVIESYEIESTPRKLEEK